MVRVDRETEVSAEINGPQGDLDVFLVDSDLNLVAQSVNEGTADAISATVPGDEPRASRTGIGDGARRACEMMRRRMTKAKPVTK